MFGRINHKIMGATLVGIALVGGALTYSRFGLGGLPQQATIAGSQAPTRNPIAVTDNDNNGVEDWRDVFTKPEAIIDEQASTSYELPTSVTGIMSLQFFEDLVRSKYNGPFAKSKEEVIATAVDTLAEEARQELFDVSDITVMETWTDEDIRNYGNAMANAILTNNVGGIPNELELLNGMLNGQSGNKEKLEILSSVYKNTLDDSLKIPVPAIFLKPHLDLVNSYNALYQDIDGMTRGTDDPAITLMFVKRYQDDALGLSLASANFYTALQPHFKLFSSSDSATFFTKFNPSNQTI